MRIRKKRIYFLTRENALKGFKRHNGMRCIKEIYKSSTHIRRFNQLGTGIWKFWTIGVFPNQYMHVHTYSANIYMYIHTNQQHSFSGGLSCVYL